MATIDYSKWAEMQQLNTNPNPNSDPSSSIVHTPNYSASYSHNPHSLHSVDPHNVLFQPQPPGVDPPYVPPHVLQQITATYLQQPVSMGIQQGAVAGAVSYYPDPNQGWPASNCQYGLPSYAAGVNLPNPASKTQKRSARKKVPKKTKVVQSAWCEACKIDCNSKDVFEQHKLGKKHKKNIEKLTRKATEIVTGTIVAKTPANNVATTSAVAAVSSSISAATTPLPVSATAPIDNPIIGPEENPNKSKNARKKAATPAVDIETKKRKVLEGGAAADAVRACNICNVVCNSDTVFNYHLAGKTHAKMMKKHISTGVAPAM